MKKKIISLLLAGTMALALMSCGGSSGGTGTSTAAGGAQSAATEAAGAAESTADAAAGGETYTFETEFTYMNDVTGGGISGAAAGLNMIVESADASGGFYVGSTHSEKCIITFKITSDADAPATLRVLAGSELGAMDMTPESFIISVNGNAVSYDKFTIPGEAKASGKTFTQFKVADIDLVSGENVITFQTGANEYCNGGPGGPLFDAIKLTSTASLTMEEHPENIE